jgi:putative transposase
MSVNTKVGIDLGLKEFAITSSGEHVPSPKFFRESERKLAKLQRALSRTEKGSNNRTKARIKIARQHERITNQRNDFLHKYSHKVVSENQVIVLEGLRVKNMIKNRRLAKSIQDAGWSRFQEFIEYKARWYGRTYVEIDTFFPSSKLCSVCGTIYRMLTLDIRSWQCPECRTVHDRDENASRNILNEGLRLLSEAV